MSLGIWDTNCLPLSKPAFLRGRDVLVCLLTSSEKSLRFALLPKLVDVVKAAVGVKYQHPSILVVFSPLISLMEDQIARFP